MKKNGRNWAVAVNGILVLMLSVVTVQAETIDCTPITSLPTIINTQGVYYLKGNLSTNMPSGNAITINKNNVTIDLNGYKIGNLAAGPSNLATGIYAYQRQNIIIKNGTIRGFESGIYIEDAGSISQGHLIENIRADQNTWIGIHVEGRGNMIRNNQVVDTGASTSTSYGILISGLGNSIINNDVFETIGSADAAKGIALHYVDGAIVENNRIGNDNLGTGETYGIEIWNSDNIVAANNRIIKMKYGINYRSGSTGKYMSNLTIGCTTPFTGGIDAGLNN